MEHHATHPELSVWVITAACGFYGISSHQHNSTALLAHLPYSCPNPWAVVVEALNTVVIHRAVMRAWRLVEVTCVVVADCDSVIVHSNIMRPAQVIQHKEAGDRLSAKRGSYSGKKLLSPSCLCNIKGTCAQEMKQSPEKEGVV